MQHDPTRREFLRLAGLAVAGALGTAVLGRSQEQQEQEKKAKSEKEQDEQEPKQAESPSSEEKQEEGEEAAREEPAAETAEQSEEETRICPQCGATMYRYGRTWTCDVCGYSYVE